MVTTYAAALVDQVLSIYVDCDYHGLPCFENILHGSY